jgi:hypothetical protein
VEITPQDVQGRARVSKLAETDARSAAETAYAIRHPWYRCQALTAAAEVELESSKALKLVDDAFSAAREQDEINRIVTVASWPLKLCVRLAPERAAAALRELVAMAAGEPHTLRRSDALHSLLFAVKDTPKLKALVLPPLVEAISQSRGWRIERIIADVAPLAKDDYPEYVSRLLGAHRENREKRKLLEELAGGSPA